MEDNPKKLDEVEEPSYRTLPNDSNTSQTSNISIQPNSSSSPRASNSGRSQSMQDLSEMTCDSSYTTKSINHLHVEPRIKKGKYAHVQSKIKLDREARLRQERLKKGRLSLEMPKNSYQEENNDVINADPKELTNQIRSLEEKIKQKESMNELLQKKVVELMEKNAECEIRTDEMRLEIHRLESELKAAKTVKLGTPVSLRNNHLFKTPIRTISRTLLSPFRITNNSAPADKDSETDSDLETEKYNKFTYDIADSPMLNNTRTITRSRASNEPLIRPNAKEPTSKISKAKCMFMNMITCSKSDNKEKEENNDIALKHVKSSRKIYPKITDDRLLNNNLRSTKNIPSILLQTPSPKNVTYNL